MVDIDINELKRVLDGLEYCIQEDTPFADCPRCPYYTSERCMQELRSDAYSVLLSIYRHETRKAKLLTIDVSDFWCGACRFNLVGHPKFCQNCGKKVKWDEL